MGVVRHMYRQVVSAIPDGQRASAASVRDRGTVRGMGIAYPALGMHSPC
jgi:hypothetical protein